MKNKKVKGVSAYIFFMLILLGVLLTFQSLSAPKEISYSKVVSLFENEKIESFVVEGSELTVKTAEGSIFAHDLDRKSVV